MYTHYTDVFTCTFDGSVGLLQGSLILSNLTLSGAWQKSCVRRL